MKWKKINWHFPWFSNVDNSPPISILKQQHNFGFSCMFFFHSAHHDPIHSMILQKLTVERFFILIREKWIVGDEQSKKIKILLDTWRQRWMSHRSAKRGKGKWFTRTWMDFPRKKKINKEIFDEEKNHSKFFLPLSSPHSAGFGRYLMQTFDANHQIWTSQRCGQWDYPSSWSCNRWILRIFLSHSRPDNSTIKIFP